MTTLLSPTPEFQIETLTEEEVKIDRYLFEKYDHLGFYLVRERDEILQTEKLLAGQSFGL